MIRQTLAAAALILALPLGSALAQDAAKPAPAKRQCFFASNVNNYSAVDDRTVNVRVGVKDVYELKLFTRCPDIDWSHKIALVSRGGSSICDGFDATIIVDSTIGPQRCQVDKVRKLTPQEVAALSSKAKP